MYILNYTHTHAMYTHYCVFECEMIINYEFSMRFKTNENKSAGIKHNNIL